MVWYPPAKKDRLITSFCKNCKKGIQYWGNASQSYKPKQYCSAKCRGKALSESLELKRKLSVHYAVKRNQKRAKVKLEILK